MNFVNVDGVTLHYTVEGTKTGTPLVFSNSLGTDLRIWDSVASEFADHSPIIRYDKRGHGLSDSPTGPYSIRNHADDLKSLLDHLQIKEAVIIGISVGGMISIAFAATYPEYIRALILCDTGAKIGTADMWNERINTLRENGMHSLGQAILERWFSSNFAKQFPAAYQGYFNMLTRTPVSGYTATCEAIRDADLREMAAAIKAETLVLCGAEDMSTPPALNQELAEMLPNAQLEVIENAGHLPCIEQPKVMATKIEQFLQAMK